MKTTSHFVGLSLDSAPFADLFVALQAYFKNHNLENTIIFQNILSLHITLYYFGDVLSSTQKAQIIQEASNISLRKTLGIKRLHLAYFGEPGNERVCYLHSQQNNTLKKINQFFAAKYNCSEAPENHLAFMPHISLFRIKDPVAYAPHKKAVDQLVESTMTTTDLANVTKGIYLYRVNSSFQPEIQIPIV